MEIFDNRMKPDFKFFINREGIKERMNFLMQEEMMNDEFLGACLDYIRWGGQTTVMYELGTKGLVNFIQHWMNLNQSNLIWNDELLLKILDFLISNMINVQEMKNIKGQ